MCAIQPAELMHLDTKIQFNLNIFCPSFLSAYYNIHTKIIYIQFVDLNKDLNNLEKLYFLWR